MTVKRNEQNLENLIMCSVLKLLSLLKQLGLEEFKVNKPTYLSPGNMDSLTVLCEHTVSLQPWDCYGL